MEVEILNQKPCSIPRAAQSVGLTARVVRGLIRRGKLSVLRLPGARPLVDPAELRAIVEVSRIPAQSE